MLTPPADVLQYRRRAASYTGDFGPWLEHLVEDEGLSLGEARAALDGFTAIPYVDAEFGHMATLIKKNKEVHFAAYRKFRHRSFITPKRIAEFFQPILDSEVFLVTKVSNNESAAFIRHLGFEELGVTLDGNFKTYILNEIRYPRTPSCK